MGEGKKKVVEGWCDVERGARKLELNSKWGLSLFWGLEFLFQNLNFRPRPLSRFYFSAPWVDGIFLLFFLSCRILFNNWRLFTLFSALKKGGLTCLTLWERANGKLCKWASGKYNCFPRLPFPIWLLHCDIPPLWPDKAINWLLCYTAYNVTPGNIIDAIIFAFSFVIFYSHSPMRKWEWAPIS